MNHYQEKGKGTKVNRENTAKTPSVNTGRLAGLRPLRSLRGIAALRAGDGSGAPSHRRRPALVFSIPLAAVLLALTAAPALAAPAIHEFTASFGAASSSPPNPYPLSEPSDVAVDNSTGPSAGDIYVSDTGNHRVEKFSPAGELLLMFGKDVNATTHGNVCAASEVCQAGALGATPGVLGSPGYIVVDNSTGPSAGDIYVLDTEDRSISKFNPSGEIVGTFGDGGKVEVPSSEPLVVGIGVEASGNVWAATYFHRGGTDEGPNLYEYNEVGETLRTLSVSGTVDDGFAIAPTGNAFYIRVVGWTEYSADGAQLGYEVAGGSLGIAPNGFLYFITEGEVFEFTRLHESYGGPFGSGVLNGPSGLSVDGATDDVYVAENGSGEVAVFDSTGPLVTTDPIENPGHTTVTLSGHADPLGRGEVTECEFEYVDESEFQANGFAGAATAPCEPATHFVGEAEVHAALSGLTAETTYHYRLVAENSHGAVPAPDRSFSLRAVFGLETKPPTEVTRHGATFNGSLNPDGIETHYHFEYVDAAHFHPGTANPYSEGASVPVPPAAPISGSTEQSVSEHEALTVQTTYHYRLVAENKYGTTYGSDETFETVPDVLEIKAEAATNVQPESAVLHGSYEGDPEGGDTKCYFQYGLSENYGEYSATPPGVDYGSSSGSHAIEAEVTNLFPHRTYHYRLVCENTIGTTDSKDEHLVTTPFVSIRNLTTQTVGPERAELKAELNPSGLAGSYTFHYGEEAGNYSGGASHGNLGLGDEFEQVTATFTGLKPNTTYHYQLVAEDSFGTRKSSDLTFTTEHSSTEEREEEHCSNQNLREENNSLTLPDCRAYEKTTPNEKGGSEAFPAVTLAPSGERVLYFSDGAFAGTVQNEIFSPYIAHRTPTGWVSQAVFAKRIAPGYEPQLGLRYTPELTSWPFAEMPGLSAEAARGGKSGFLSIGFGDGSYNVHATPTITLQEDGGENTEARSWYYFMEVTAQSEDSSHLFISTASHDLPAPEDPRPGDPYFFGIKTRIYEVSGATGPNPTMKLIVELPLNLSPGTPYTPTGCDIDPYGTDGLSGEQSSADGSTLFYTAPVDNVPGEDCGNGTPNPIGFFGLKHGEAPLQLNVAPASQCASPAPCATAPTVTPRLQGISPEGNLAWFTTTQPLINSDTDTTNDLYLAKLEPDGQLAELVQASAGEPTATHPHPGEGAEVQGVVAVSKDGTHAAFVASAVLTEHENALHQSAAQGADNLYVYDASSGETKFVTRLCSGPEKSGSVTDTACPEGSGEADSELWREYYSKSELTPNGNYLLFTSVGRLAPGDTDNVADVYRYDFQTGQLIRVSFGRDGNDGNGNDNRFPDEIRMGGGNGPREDDARSISEDGSTIIFGTAAPLVSHDTNEGANPGCGPGQTGCDIYEWEEQGHGTCQEAGGCISLISDGTDPHGSISAVIGSSGRDIAFGTSDNLIPEDTDGVGDIYDARAEGGFHAAHPPAPCGSPEACRPAPGAQPSPPTLGSETFVGPGNAKEHLTCTKGKVRIKKHGQVRCASKKHHKRHKHHKRANTNRGGGR